jgi:hypothetical protein
MLEVMSTEKRIQAERVKLLAAARLAERAASPAKPIPAFWRDAA